MASIRKQPNGRWKVVYWTADGRGQRAQRFDRKVDAERFAATVEADKLRGTWLDPKLGQLRFEELAQRWLPSTGHLRPGTRDNIESRLKNHVLPPFGDMPVGRIRPHHVREWRTSLSASGLAPGTVKSIYGILARILQTAEIDGLIVRSPAIRITLPKEAAREEMIFLSPAQIADLAEAIMDRFSALIYTAAYTGMRVGELAALRVQRVNVLKGVIDAVESMSEVNGQLHIGPTKTGARRTISLPRFLAEMLGEHIGRHVSRDGSCSPRQRGCRSVAGTPTGGITSPPCGRRAWTSVSGFTIMPTSAQARPSAHLRSAAHRAGCASQKEIQERLGHSTIRLTFDRYGHLFPSLDDRLREGLQVMYENARVSKACPDATSTLVVCPACGARNSA